VDDVRVVLAPNPGVMTGPGTNQYVLGREPATVIDVAPYDDENARRLAAGTAGPVAQVLLTHVHADHVGGARPFADAAGVPIAVHRSRAAHVTSGGPLAPARLLDDGEEIAHAAGRLRVVHTPGHESGHCCYYDPDRRWLFTGDTILGTGTVVIPPPDGDMAAYLASLRRLRGLDLVRILPGHGPAIDRPYEKIDEYLAHRLLRERQIVAVLDEAPATIATLVERIYVGLAPVLHGAAAMTVRAHLQKLVDDGVVAAPDGDDDGYALRR
jgi:glyoxylase-like metal-dependent hydrolase (beta-lactamase superfamily II)